MCLLFVSPVDGTIRFFFICASRPFAVNEGFDHLEQENFKVGAKELRVGTILANEHLNVLHEIVNLLIVQTVTFEQHP